MSKVGSLRMEDAKQDEKVNIVPHRELKAEDLS
jgi:hypothetical protein